MLTPTHACSPILQHQIWRKTDKWITPTMKIHDLHEQPRNSWEARHRSNDYPRHCIPHLSLKDSASMMYANPSSPSLSEDRSAVVLLRIWLMNFCSRCTDSREACCFSIACQASGNRCYVTNHMPVSKVLPLGSQLRKKTEHRMQVRTIAVSCCASVSQEAAIAGLLRLQLLSFTHPNRGRA